MNPKRLSEARGDQHAALLNSRWRAQSTCSPEAGGIVFSTAISDVAGGDGSYRSDARPRSQ